MKHFYSLILLYLLYFLFNFFIIKIALVCFLTKKKYNNKNFSKFTLFVYLFLVKQKLCCVIFYAKALICADLTLMTNYIVYKKVIYK